MDIMTIKHNKKMRNAYIKEKIPFVIHMVSVTMGRYIETENDIEFSIGLVALNDAIDTYDASKGTFETYAGTIIKNRIIDEMRKGYQEPVDYHEEALITSESDVDLKIEINEYSDKLKQFGMTFDDLVSCSPNHQDTRVRAISLSCQISKDHDIVRRILEKLKLPVGEIVKKIRETRRFIYAHKAYILGTSLIYIYDFSQLRDWIESVRGHDKKE